MSLSLLAYRRRFWRLNVGALSWKSLSSASRRRCCFVVVVSGVPSCGLVCRILRLVVVVVVLLFSLATASPQSKLTYPFVPKFQEGIGTNREVFEIVLALFSLQQVPGLSNRCTFSLANFLAG